MLRRQQAASSALSKEEQDNTNAAAARFSAAVDAIRAKNAIRQRLDDATCERLSMLETARAWRQQEGFVGRGGVVVIHQGEVIAWRSVLSGPENWVPGCVAVAEDGRSWTATAEIAQHGCLMWLVNDRVE